VTKYNMTKNKAQLCSIFRRARFVVCEMRKNYDRIFSRLWILGSEKIRHPRHMYIAQLYLISHTRTLRTTSRTYNIYLGMKINNIYSTLNFQTQNISTRLPRSYKIMDAGRRTFLLWQRLSWTTESRLDTQILTEKEYNQEINETDIS